MQSTEKLLNWMHTLLTQVTEQTIRQQAEEWLQGRDQQQEQWLKEMDSQEARWPQQDLQSYITGGKKIAL